MRPVVFLLLLAACGCGGPTSETSVDPATLPPERQFLDEIDKSMAFRDILPTVRAPEFVPAADAPRMKDDERVLGLDLGDVQVAYPVQVLNLIEIVEHSIAGKDLLVCWCAMCGTGVVHERRIDGRVLTFGHAGRLWHNAFLLYDRGTESLWHHATGVAMSGPMRGRRLPFVASTAVMTYGAWLAEHPRTLVLKKRDDPDVETDVYATRNAHRSWGLALVLAESPRFYPLDALPPLGAVEDEVAGVPVVVVQDAAARTALAFDRRVDGVALSFDVEAGADGRPMLRERGGRRAWFLRSGAPSSGSDDALVPIAATPFEAAAWKLQNPTGVVWRRP